MSKLRAEIRIRNDYIIMSVLCDKILKIVWETVKDAFSWSSLKWRNGHFINDFWQQIILNWPTYKFFAILYFFIHSIINLSYICNKIASIFIQFKMQHSFNEKWSEFSDQIFFVTSFSTQLAKWTISLEFTTLDKS